MSATKCHTLGEYDFTRTTSLTETSRWPFFSSRAISRRRSATSSAHTFPSVALPCTCNTPPVSEDSTRTADLHPTSLEGIRPRFTLWAWLHKDPLSGPSGVPTVEESPSRVSTLTRCLSMLFAFASREARKPSRARGFQSTATSLFTCPPASLPAFNMGREKYPIPQKRSTTVSPSLSPSPLSFFAMAALRMLAAIRILSVPLPLANMHTEASNRNFTPASVWVTHKDPRLVRGRTPLFRLGPEM
mmetsp:Transcript_4683/g.9412  ORF Transcript_4683/g.9412 Transcript_4683/m.9412 type:complete len:245 (-) Transcript_4683:1050-1784(-)